MNDGAMRQQLAACCDDVDAMVMQLSALAVWPDAAPG